jgi:O-antigen ligase
MSTGLRVRWRGQLDDPNELSVFIGAVIPLLFAIGMPTGKSGSQLSGASRGALITLAIVMLGLGLYAVILSQSRGGQLVVAAVFTVYFVSKFKTKGLVLAALFALPVLLFGGRDDSAADESAQERIELLYEGVSLVIAHPFRGVGVDQFADRVQASTHLTAHNAYLLAAAEVGFPGFFFWSGLMWSSFKIPLTILKKPVDAITPELRSLAMALAVSFFGIAVGIFFLSFTYKQLLFVWFGLAGALYGVMKEIDPAFEVKVGRKDLLGIIVADVTMIGLLYVYTRARGVG